ncbi:MAG TPA: cytochrome P460 family protein [Candidatus Latescibacteria bacterium]|nr:hypothetical protein [Gemmatimonadaceae bacterium]MDP6014573.1 cytochrome P460 family protein [Candidatus Latescibacterota bacterium]HJP30241.1 cytochrome P460 family protein [Candidatus Latescibacterota bacterium]|tara:strand:+ start:1978 stop:2520 length:543 start_codon:yes stop_codon:yes gene_type:complete
MLRKWTLALALSAAVLTVNSQAQAQDTPPFGDPESLAYAAGLWEQMAEYRGWKLTTPVYMGEKPHGNMLRMFSSYVTVGDVARPVIVKESFGGEGVTIKGATDSPDEWLKAITVMLQREPGYDEDNENWFWVKYAPDGSVMKNPKGMQLAGRVAKGAKAGCIACHLSAEGDDYLYFNDSE